MTAKGETGKEGGTAVKCWEGSDGRLAQVEGVFRWGGRSKRLATAERGQMFSQRPCKKDKLEQLTNQIELKNPSINQLVGFGNSLCVRQLACIRLCRQRLENCV